MTPPPFSGQWLPPIAGLHRKDPEHRYYLGSVSFPVSITGVLAASKSAFAMARIEATRDAWEPRGNACHRALELWLLTPPSRPSGPPGGLSVVAKEMKELEELEELLAGDYGEWIAPLISHERWRSVSVIASERATCCVRRGLAGQYDTGFLDPSLPPSPLRPTGVEGPARVLADLKSLGANGATYSTAAQIGGYMALDWSHGLWWDWGQTIWARPGRTVFSALYGVPECRMAWAGAWATYRAIHRDTAPRSTRIELR